MSLAIGQSFLTHEANVYPYLLSQKKEPIRTSNDILAILKTTKRHWTRQKWSKRGKNKQPKRKRNRGRL